jgi:protoheme IX farnesyltransferase
MVLSLATTLPKNPSRLSDLVTLLKPKIMIMAVVAALAGLWLAQGGFASSGGANLETALAALLGIALSSGAACALNMLIERRTDALMSRTKDRPVAAGRVSPQLACCVGVGAGVLGVGILGYFVNGLTCVLSLVALVSYVLIYTPLKRRTSLAFIAGFVPGALPALMGYTASSGTLDVPGLALFAFVVLWQIPHVMALYLYLGEDYARAGIVVLPRVVGPRAVGRMAFASAAILVLSSLFIIPLAKMGYLYGVVAILAGTWFLARGLPGLRVSPGSLWAKAYFRCSLVYLAVVLLGLILDQGVA